MSDLPNDIAPAGVVASPLEDNEAHEVLEVGEDEPQRELIKALLQVSDICGLTQCSGTPFTGHSLCHVDDHKQYAGELVRVVVDGAVLKGMKCFLVVGASHKR